MPALEKIFPVSCAPFGATLIRIKYRMDGCAPAGAGLAARPARRDSSESLIQIKLRKNRPGKPAARIEQPQALGLSSL